MRSRKVFKLRLSIKNIVHLHEKVEYKEYLRRSKMIYPIRILQVFGGLNRGGSETAIMNVYRNIDRKKVQFDFIVHTNERCDYEDEIESLGGYIYRFSRYKISNHWKYQKEWGKFFANHPEYKIIHGQYYTISSIYFQVAKKYGLMCIAHSHIAQVKGKRALFIKILAHPLRHISDYLFACSKVAGLWLYGKRAIKNNNFHIIKNAIDTKQFIFNQDIRLKLRVELKFIDKFVIGHVGRFTNQKNHLFLINIFKKVHEKNDKSILLLIGEGNLKKSMEKRIFDLGLSDSVIFTGVRPDVAQLMQAMDIFVLPSLYEGLGIVAVEAQAAGLHCIVSDTIPRDAYLTELIEPLSLKDSISIWVNRILKYTDCERENTSQDIKNGGYDIVETAKWLENFYIKNWRE